jgi:hypothetical protein
MINAESLTVIGMSSILQRRQETETGFSLDKQLVTPYRTTHTDELNALGSGVYDQILGTPLVIDRDGVRRGFPESNLGSRKRNGGCRGTVHEYR